MSHMPLPATEDELETLSGYLVALGNPRRLELLGRLRTPRVVGEIQLRPSRSDGESNPARPVSRNAVERHLKILRAIGVVAGRPAERDGRRVEEFVLQHARLFQVVEALRDLTQLRPLDPARLDVTASGDAASHPHSGVGDVKGPHVILLSGPMEGRVRALEGRGPWTIGRADACAVALDYDPYVSSQHAVVDAAPGGGLILRDLPTNRNGTLIDWKPVPRGGAAPLRSGAVVRVGRSLLLYRDGN